MCGGKMDKVEFDNRYSLKYNRLFSMIEHIGPELNDRKNRFDKADLIEACLEAATKGRLAWEDNIGYDNYDSENDEKFEVKSQGNSLYTQSGNLKKKTSSIKLTNTLQKSLNKSLKCTADYLIIIDSKQFSMAVIPYEEVVNKYSTELNDGFSCQIPTSSLTFLRTPEEYVKVVKENVTSYAEEKRRLQKEYVNSWCDDEV
jgi:hypothetical protein